MTRTGALALVVLLWIAPAQGRAQDEICGRAQRDRLVRARSDEPGALRNFGGWAGIDRSEKRRPRRLRQAHGFASAIVGIPAKKWPRAHYPRVAPSVSDNSAAFIGLVGLTTPKLGHLVRFAQRSMPSIAQPKGLAAAWALSGSDVARIQRFRCRHVRPHQSVSAG